MRRQRGFSLIEALIALLVLSLGLVGVAAMQLKALQSATVGYQRSVVTLAAVDAQERLWAELAKINQGISDKENCTEIEAADIENEWKDWWNADQPTNPLRNVDWDASGIESENGCEFTIQIVLNDGPGSIDTDFSYTFRLPEL